MAILRCAVFILSAAVATANFLPTPFRGNRSPVLATVTTEVADGKEEATGDADHVPDAAKSSATPFRLPFRNDPGSYRKANRDSWHRWYKTPIYEAATHPLSDYMTKVGAGLVTLDPQMSLNEAGKILKEKKLACAPVVNEDGQLVGDLSRKDVVYKIAGRDSFRKTEGKRTPKPLHRTAEGQPTEVRKVLEASVENSMTRFPISLKPTATVQQATHLMIRRRLNSILITDPKTGCLLGMISASDLFEITYDG